MPVSHNTVAARRQRATAPKILEIRPEITAGKVVIDRLQRRFGLSEPVACLVARLAGIGPAEVRQ